MSLSPASTLSDHQLFEMGTFFAIAVVGHVATTLWFNSGYVLWTVLALFMWRMTPSNGIALGLGWSLPPTFALVVNLSSYQLPPHISPYVALLAPVLAFCGTNVALFALSAWAGVRWRCRGLALVGALWLCAIPSLLPMSAGSMLPILASSFPVSGHLAFAVTSIAIIFISTCRSESGELQLRAGVAVALGTAIMGALSAHIYVDFPVHNDVWMVDHRGELQIESVATETTKRWVAGQRFVVAPEGIIASLTPENDARLVTLGRAAVSADARAVVGLNVVVEGRTRSSAIVVGEPEAGLVSAMVTIPLVGATGSTSAQPPYARVGLERLVVLFCYEEMTLAPLWKRIDEATLVASLANHYWDRFGWITRQQLMFAKRWAKIFRTEIWRSDATYNGASIHA